MTNSTVALDLSHVRYRQSQNKRCQRQLILRFTSRNLQTTSGICQKQSSREKYADYRWCQTTRQGKADHILVHLFQFPEFFKQKPTVWARQNKGVDARATKDIQEISKPTLESARTILERKAKIYDKLRKGKSGGLDDKQYDALLVDVRAIQS